jgi:hypothetical protein
MKIQQDNIRRTKHHNTGGFMKDNIFKSTFAGAAIAALLITLGCQNLSVAKKHDKDKETEWTFDKEELSSLPEGWKVAETAGTGTMATWKIVADNSAPSKPQAVAVTESKNRGHTFNLLIAEESKFKDVEVEVKVKAVGGKDDQGGGPIWRAKDKDNYYICRWNPLENNFRVYVVKEGKRKELGSAKVDADASTWHEIEILHKGAQITAEFDDRKLILLEDSTFQDAGMVGLWTKADATTAFDNFEVEVVGD